MQHRRCVTTIAMRRPLGRTGLSVSPLGIGGGAGLPSEDALYAYDRGINYFFFSSDLHHFRYRRMAEALRTLCGRGSRERENVVLAGVTYVKSPELLEAVLFDQFEELGIDYLDILFWGWMGQADGPWMNAILSEAEAIRGPGSRASRFVEEAFGASERLKRLGAVRFLGASFHDVDLAAQWLNSPLLDVVMVRYNPAHRRAHARVLAPATAIPARPGIVTFKSQDADGGSLTKRRPWLPPDRAAPTHGDLYRFALSAPAVDVCLTGPATRAHVDASLDALARGPLSAAESRALLQYGEAFRRATMHGSTR